LFQIIGELDKVIKNWSR